MANPLGMQILEALGIDEKYVFSADIHMSTKKIIVDLEILVPQKDINTSEIQKERKRYCLTEIE